MITVFWVLYTLYTFVYWLWQQLWVIGQDLVNGAQTGVDVTWKRTDDGDRYSSGLALWAVSALERFWKSWLQPALVDVFHLLITVNEWFGLVAGHALAAGRALRDRVLVSLVQHLLDLYALFRGWRDVLGRLKDRLAAAAAVVDLVLHGDLLLEYKAFERAREHLNDLIAWTNYGWHFDGLLRITPFLASVEEWGSWVLGSIMVGLRLPDGEPAMEDLRRQYPELTVAQVLARVVRGDPDLEAAATAAVQAALLAF